MKKTYAIITLAILLCVMFTFNSFADTINIPADYATIQAGIDAATNGDVVLVQPGTYIENLNYNGKNITLASLFYTTMDTSYISQTVIDGSSSAVVVNFAGGEDSTAVLTGFTITNGNANYGGGIYCYESSPTIEHALIVANNSNYYGAGICCWDSDSNIEHVTITANSAGYYGGGICCNDSDISIKYVTVTGNSATNGGGGLYCENSSAILQNVLISNNCTTAQYGHGGGISCTSSSPSLQDVAITGNNANSGGGIYCSSSSPTLNNVAITGNSVNTNGGGIWCYGLNSSPVLQHVAITGNSAGYYGGGIYCYHYSPANLDNVTIADNTALSGGGIYSGDNSSPVVKNSILWNDSPEEIVIETASINVSYSDIEGAWTGTGNIDADPLFVDPLNGDYHLSWVNFPTPDATKSPCIDTGDPASPLDPDGTLADMGAYYFNQNAAGIDPQETPKPMLINYPNPISSRVEDLKVSFSIQKTGNVKIQLFNLQGKLVSTFINEDKNIGEHTVDSSVNHLSSGIYFTKLSINGVEREITKLVVLK